MKDHEHGPARPEAPGASAAGRRPGNSLSMHEGIGVWCDCCSCEAEERWVEVGERLGMDFSDYERPDEPESS